MSFDKKVPQQLKRTQEWFGSILLRPIDENSKMNPLSPSGKPMEEEACQFIRPSPTLKPDQRIQIYNQQYWWRLLNTLQETFPLVTRLFGFHSFNFTIAIPYLLKYRPNHWTLNVVGDFLPQWVQKHYKANDRELIYHAALIDCAFNHSFTCNELTPCKPSENVMEQILYLQPHLHLFEMPYDLFSFRSAFLKESPDYWSEHPFPPLSKENSVYYTVLYRNLQNDISWISASKAQYTLLKQFKKGISVDKACEWLEKQEEEILEEAAENLQQWLQEWVVNRWLTVDKC